MRCYRVIFYTKSDTFILAGDLPRMHVFRKLMHLEKTHTCKLHHCQPLYGKFILKFNPMSVRLNNYLLKKQVKKLENAAQIAACFFRWQPDKLQYFLRWTEGCLHQQESRFFKPHGTLTPVHWTVCFIGLSKTKQVPHGVTPICGCILHRERTQVHFDREHKTSEAKRKLNNSLFINMTQYCTSAYMWRQKDRSLSSSGHGELLKDARLTDEASLFG